jgi:hypothetical protein
VSSSSSTDTAWSAPGSIATRLAAAFDHLACDTPELHRALAEALGALRARIRVDDEVFDVVAVRRAPTVCAVHGTASVSIDTSRAVVHDVLGGRVTMAEALRDDTLRVRGALRDLVAVLHAIETFVHGAVRSRSVAALFQEFQEEGVA